MPSRRQTSVALTATSAPMKIIDQPTGLRARRGRGSPSAASSAGAGSFIGGSDKTTGLAGDGYLPVLSPGIAAKQTEARPIPMRIQGDAHASASVGSVSTARTKRAAAAATAPRKLF